MTHEILAATFALIGLAAGALVNRVGDWLTGGPVPGERPLRRPAIALLTALLFAAIAWRHGADAMLPVWCVFAASLVACASIDVEHRIIPDELSLGGLLVALVAVPASVRFGGGSFAETFVRALAGALLGGGTLWLVGFAHARASVALGRRFEHWPGPGESLPAPGSVDYWTWFPGVGLGDVKLMGMVGAVLGPLGVIEAIAATSLAGGVLGLVVALVTRSWSTSFGFAPAIAAGALVVVLVPGHLLRA